MLKSSNIFDETLSTLFVINESWAPALSAITNNNGKKSLFILVQFI